MTDKNRNLLLRVVSALLLLPVVLYLLYRGGLFSAVLMAGASAVCAMEYYTITQKRLSPAALLGMVAAFLLPLFPAVAPASYAELSVGVVAVFFLIAWGYHLVRGPLPEAPTLAAHLITGLLYGGIGLTALSALRQRPDGLGWVICALTVTWLNDTLAYFAGRFLGRHKLYPAVSPNKTWEGFAGGVVGSVVGMFAVKAVYFPTLTVADCLLVGLPAGVLGPAGDLCESLLKRAYGVKDSGKIIPGHGGLLDRIDALLFNAPLVFAYAQYVRPLLTS